MSEASLCPICRGAKTIIWDGGLPMPAGGLGWGQTCHGCGGSGVVWPPHVYQEAARRQLEDKERDIPHRFGP